MTIEIILIFDNAIYYLRGARPGCTRFSFMPRSPKLPATQLQNRHWLSQQKKSACPASGTLTGTIWNTGP